MAELRYSTDIGGIVRYLRGHAEATLYDARRDPALRAELLRRCFGARGAGFRYRRDPRKQDIWKSFSVSLVQDLCRPFLTRCRAAPPEGWLEIDCEDFVAYFAAAAWLSGYQSVDVCITQPNPPSGEAHCWLITGPRGRPPEGIEIEPTLEFPEPGGWDPSAWHGMAVPKEAFYAHPNTVQLRLRDD